RYWPSVSVTLVRVVLVSTWRAVTVAPGTTPPCSSVTLPRSVARLVCAEETDARPTSKHAARVRGDFDATMRPPSRETRRGCPMRRMLYRDGSPHPTISLPLFWGFPAR